MKHKIKKVNAWTAGCTRPGCIASLAGGMVGDMSQKELNSFFENTDCPAVFNSKNPKLSTASFKERVEYLLKYAQKEKHGWEKLIEYWKKMSLDNFKPI